MFWVERFFTTKMANKSNKVQNFSKVTGLAKFRLLFLFSSGIIFESTNLSSFLQREKSLSPILEEIIAIMKG